MGWAYYPRARSYSRSFNSEEAERDGRMPLTRFCETYGLDSDKVKARGTREWHHVGKYAAKVDYYDWRSFIGDWERFSRKRPRPDQLARRESMERRWEEEQQYTLLG